MSVGGVGAAWRAIGGGGALSNPSRPVMIAAFST